MAILDNTRVALLSLVEAQIPTNKNDQKKKKKRQIIWSEQVNKFRQVKRSTSETLLVGFDCP